jgi:hypothetical protein
MFKKVLGIVSLVGVVAVGSGLGCSVTTIASSTDSGADTDPAPSASSTIDASKPKTDGAAALTCYDEEGALAQEGTAPVRGAGKCTDAQITELDQKCLGSAATACDPFIAANKDCARCILGALDGDNAATTPIGALISVSEDSVAPNTASCAAIFIGKPECAAKLAIQEVCLASACALCETDATDASCRKEAAAGVCKTVIDATCTQAIESRAAEWQAACSGADFETTYPKVAKFLCGGASTDAGGGG